jgi:hypothetical protein
MLPVGSRKCCTYVLHILFLGTPDRNTWRKTHTFHQVPTRPAALSFTPCFLSLSLFFSLVFLSLTKYVSSLFTRPNLQQQHSTCLRLYLYKASGGSWPKTWSADAQHAKLFTSALYKLMIILSLSIFVCAAIINHTLFFL